MFIVTALIRKLPIKMLELTQDIELCSDEKLGHFPVFKNIEQAQAYVEKLYKAQGVECNIIALNENGEVK